MWNEKSNLKQRWMNVMATITFPKIEYKIDIKVKCPKCGKSRKKVLSEYQTQSPFNKNDEGTLKSREQIYKDVKEKVYRIKENLDKTGSICNNCRDNTLDE